jgi:hypothetical protein
LPSLCLVLLKGPHATLQKQLYAVREPRGSRRTDRGGHLQLASTGLHHSERALRSSAQRARVRLTLQEGL